MIVTDPTRGSLGQAPLIWRVAGPAPGWLGSARISILTWTGSLSSTALLPSRALQLSSGRVIVPLTWSVAVGRSGPGMASTWAVQPFDAETGQGGGGGTVGGGMAFPDCTTGAAQAASAAKLTKGRKRAIILPKCPADDPRSTARRGWKRPSPSASAVSMTALDIFVFLLIVGGAAIGFVRGFVHEVLSLLAWIVAIAMLKLFHAQLARGLDSTMDLTTTAAAVIAFALLFLPSFLLVKLLARSIGGRTRRSPLIGPVDRVLGGGFGALKGLLSATLFFLFANLATDMVYGPQADRPRWMLRSSTYPLLNASGRAIVDWVEVRRKGEVEP
jgi:membrane protein required for colicin V production